MRYKTFLSIITLLIISILSGHSQNGKQFSRNIEWHSNADIKASSSQPVKISFKKASFRASEVPHYVEDIPLNEQNFSYLVSLANEVFSPVENAGNLANSDEITESINVRSTVSVDRKKQSLFIDFIPLRKNVLTGKIEKLISFSIVISKNGMLPQSNRVYAPNSVLQNGSWYKFGLTRDGVYKLNYDFLKFRLRMNLDNVSPSDIRVFGNGGGMVPMLNSVDRKDDLNENAIFVYDGGTPGVFDSPDYILMYGQSPDRFSFDAASGRFMHAKHLYTDTTYYFITSDFSSTIPAKRIQQIPSLSATPNHNVNTVDVYEFHEEDLVNLIKSGREFYGELFDVNNKQTFSFFIPDLTNDSVWLRFSYMAHSPGVTSTFNIKYNNSQLFSQAVTTIGGTNADYGVELNSSRTFNPQTGSNLDFNLEYLQGNSSSVGYLNFLEINARRNLSWNTNAGVDQIFFRDKISAGAGNISSFSIANAPVGVKVWNVTDPVNVFEQLTSSNGNFTAETNNLNEYIAFGGDQFLSPSAIGKIDNQDLHALPQTDFIIVTNPAFESEANRLAEFHRTHDNMRVTVANTPHIFNEYSSGAQDISAIRDFIKMFYDRATVPEDLPKYVLIFGDGSYDNKNRKSNNTNFVPTFESANSYSYIYSYTTDDFYALMDDNEGLVGSSEKIDIGVGRFPVQSLSQAQVVVDKTIRYASTPSATINTICTGGCNPLGDWRNVLTFVADDEDGNLHVSQADDLADFLFNTNRQYNIEKIYMDAFRQTSGAGGEGYPDVTAAINKRIERGTLLFNYVGHGGEVGLAQEGIIGNSTIYDWENFCKLPVFVTATCEFSRWEDPARTSAGENIFLSDKGAGVALFSTTRLVYATQNSYLNSSMIHTMFTLYDGKHPRLGDIYRISKTDPQNLNDNTRNFSLLGDPALMMAYPKHTIEATGVNGHPLVALQDTVGALSKVTVSGIISSNGQKLTNFNGYMYPTVFDKPVNSQTLANDGGSTFPFTLQKNVLYKGKASIVNGDWSFTFIVPKDIAYNYGLGKFSFYAENGIEDGSGFYDSLVVGGSSGNLINDAEGPSVKLYMNDDKFVFGSITNDKPNIYAVLLDSSGINTVGNGVGHDIVARLDNKYDPVYVLNDYYQSDLNSYQSGIISYPLEKLSEGQHSLKLKVWDILNNSSEAYTEFVVSSSAELALDHVLNYPNPFTTKTTFSFEHNKPCTTLGVLIQVYTVSGKLIKTLNKYITCSGFRVNDIAWDGRDDFGDRIGRGVYIYRLKISTLDGATASKTEKLVILK